MVVAFRVGGEPEARTALQTQSLPDTKAFTTAKAAWIICEYLSLH
jgi:hypothetical protein